jgi:energy-coupling factor transport system permease protein
MKIPFGFVFMITTALRFVPLMRKKIACIREAQMARGIDLRFKLKNAKNFMALLGPLLVQSLRFSDELAIAMEVRGFGRKNRSSRKVYAFRIKDFLAVALAVAALAISVAWQMDAGFENRTLAFVSDSVRKIFTNGN